MRKFAALLTTLILWVGLTTPGLAAPIIYENGTRSSNPNEPTYGFYPSPTSTFSISASFSVSVAQTAQSVMFASAFANDASLESVQWSISTAINGTGTVLGSGTALVNNFYMNARSVASLNDYLTTFSLPNLDLAVGSYFLTLSQPVLNPSSSGVGWTAAQGSPPPATRFTSPSGATQSILSGYFVLFAVPELNAARAGLPLLFSALILVTFRRRSIRLN